MADSNLPQFADPFLVLLLDKFLDQQIRLTDRLLADALLRECVKSSPHEKRAAPVLRFTSAALAKSHVSGVQNG